MRVMDDGSKNPMGSRGDKTMAFKESAGQFLVGMLHTAFHATVGLIAIIWVIFALCLSQKLATVGLAYIDRMVLGKRLCGTSSGPGLRASELGRSLPVARQQTGAKCTQCPSLRRKLT